jgi:hypothetical protein
LNFLADEKKRRVVAAVFLFVALVSSVVAYAVIARHFYQSYWVDDAAISFNFARNIAEGYGSVVTPGDERVEGFSNPTWVALLALTNRVGGDPFTWSQNYGFAFGLAVLLLLALFAVFPRPEGGANWPIAVAALLVATNAGFVLWNQSGMENGIYALLLTASIFLVVRESRDPEARPWSALPLFLLAITRPEGVGHTAVAGFFLLLTDLIERRRPSRRLLVWAGAFLAMFGAYHLWHYIYFAYPFPNTYYAKVRPNALEQITSPGSRGWSYVLNYLHSYGFLPLLVLALPAFAGKRAWREALYFALTAAFLAFFPLYAGGDWMKSWRFLSYFPIPLALLLGLAAANLWRLLQKPLAKRMPRPVAAGIAIALAVAWTAGPVAATLPKSNVVLGHFLDDREVSAKGIARRARWWSGVAEKLALRPVDTMMCDMDMGGTTYNWPGRMMDIGYLLSVPMARHRYTRDWPAMMNEHFFTEMRPDFIHIRRGWGRATTVPGNPKFKREYLSLPDDKRFSRSKPNGNYVRRDRIERAAPVPTDWTPRVFSGGLTLHAVEIPEALSPRQETPVFLTWSRGPERLADRRFLIGLARPEGEPELEEYKPLMGWLETRDWPQSTFLREVVYLKVPRREGKYELHVGVAPRNETPQVQAVPVTVRVDANRAMKLAEQHIAAAQKLAAENAVTALQAPEEIRLAEFVVGETEMTEERAEVEATMVDTFVAAAQRAVGEGQFAAAAFALAPAWRLAPRDDRLDELGWQVARSLYETGRQHQLHGEFARAFEAFTLAAKAQPQHAWARRRAEEVRMLR